MKCTPLRAVFAMLMFIPLAAPAGAAGLWAFAFGNGRPAAGEVTVAADALLAESKEFGFLPGLAPAAGASRERGVGSDKPFVFKVRVPEGNYRVRVVLGGGSQASETTVKAEARRLMVERVETAAGETREARFCVNVRRPEIAGGGKVGLRGNMGTHPDWDEFLSFEFAGVNPSLVSLAIEAAPEAATVFIAGDSTVTNQTKEPYASWGQMLPRFLDDTVAVANYAESGRSLRSSLAERRFAKIYSQLKKGDHVFIQFAHNDQKKEADAFTGGWDKLLMEQVDKVLAAGATPVLVTPVLRRWFGKDGKITDSMGNYPEAMRRVAGTAGVPLVDLHAMSRTLYEAMGPEASMKALVHFPAGTFPGQDKPLKDDTHFSAFGAYQIARCVVEGIRAKVPGLAGRLRPDIGVFDPVRPGRWEDWKLPASPLAEVEKPEGN